MKNGMNFCSRLTFALTLVLSCAEFGIAQEYYNDVEPRTIFGDLNRPADVLLGEAEAKIAKTRLVMLLQEYTRIRSDLDELGRLSKVRHIKDSHDQPQPDGAMTPEEYAESIKVHSLMLKHTEIEIRAACEKLDSSWLLPVNTGPVYGPDVELLNTTPQVQVTIRSKTGDVLEPVKLTMTSLTQGAIGFTQIRPGVYMANHPSVGGYELGWQLTMKSVVQRGVKLNVEKKGCLKCEITLGPPEVQVKTEWASLNISGHKPTTNGSQPGYDNPPAFGPLGTDTPPSCGPPAAVAQPQESLKEQYARECKNFPLALSFRMTLMGMASEVNAWDGLALADRMDFEVNKPELANDFRQWQICFRAVVRAEEVVPQLINDPIYGRPLMVWVANHMRQDRFPGSDAPGLIALREKLPTDPTTAELLEFLQSTVKLDLEATRKRMEVLRAKVSPTAEHYKHCRVAEMNRAPQDYRQMCYDAVRGQSRIFELHDELELLKYSEPQTPAPNESRLLPRERILDYSILWDEECLLSYDFVGLSVANDLGERIVFYYGSPAYRPETGRPTLSALADVPFREGRIHGKVRRWTEDGKLLMEVPYRHGLIEGECRFYNRKGKLLGTSTLMQGTGTYRIWDRNKDEPILLKEVSYLDGKVQQ